MGFLNNSTNQILLDAVLTDEGRKNLANGTFNITKFALGDDEIDYGIIKKFGRTVGKEKMLIEKWAREAGLGISGSAFGGW